MKFEISLSSQVFVFCFLFSTVEIRNKLNIGNKLDIEISLSQTLGNSFRTSFNLTSGTDVEIKYLNPDCRLKKNYTG